MSTYGKCGSGEYMMHICIHNCKRRLYLYIQKLMEDEDDKQNPFEEVMSKSSFLRKLHSMKFAWNDGERAKKLKAIIETGDLYSEAEFERDEVDGMTIPPKKKINLSTDNATEVTLTVKIIDKEGNKLLLSEMLHFKLSADQMPEETRPGIEHYCKKSKQVPEETTFPINNFDN